MRRIIFWTLRLLYGFRAWNTGPLKNPGPVLLLPNHLSWFDWLFLGACLEKDWRFVTSSTTANISWLHRWIMVNRLTFPVDMNSPYAVKHMAEYLQRGGRLVLFPEGRMSSTGSLMKLFDGTGFLIHKTGAKVITAYLRGAGRLRLSRNPNRKEWFPRISLHFSDVLFPPRLAHVGVAEARTRLMNWLRDQMVRQQFEVEMQLGPATVPAAIAATARKNPGRVFLEDISLQQINGRRLLVGADLLAVQWRRLISSSEQRIGVLLPNVNAMPVTLLSLWFGGKVPAILNYTTGATILLACARLATLKTIITSKAFIERGQFDLEPLKRAGIQFLFLEEIRPQITAGQKASVLLRRLLGSGPRLPATEPADTAVVLFTSGSEGDPKGVELTHGNLLSNMRQMSSVIDLMETDRFFNALPLFHSFGLTVGLLLPLVHGEYVFLYLSPLHYRVVPSAFYNLNCTVFFGTNTFLNGYGRKAHPYDFRSVRYLFAGAEKLQESTVQMWMKKFGVRVMEGYGATECSPCLSANIPMHPRPGSAGQFLPGVEYRLEPVEGISDSSGAVGRLFVRGPNIMRGYLNSEANEKFKALSGWYDTGDIARVDADGFVYILGRLKRFAKISGEMVSLTAVEEALAGAFPQFGAKFTVAVVARPDDVKGEKLIAVSNEPRLTLDQVRDAVRARGLGNLAAPREVKIIHELPRLGTGKVNHRELEKMV
jgi:acyl-[acyl-carrier-protein]-phospholipid O-acyltransferase/long-chain-fatty-acid--[acyl-carrier-protein] ligase